jgi:hypothetical protein
MLQSNTGNQYVSILENTDARVVAQQQPQPSSIGLSVGILFLFAAFIAFRRQWVFSGIIVVVGASILYFTYKPHNDVYLMELDRQHGIIYWETLNKDKIIASRQSPAAAYKSAVLDTSNAGHRLVLVHPDGTQDYPLGDKFLPGQNAHFVLIKDLQDMVQAAQDSNTPKP